MHRSRHNSRSAQGLSGGHAEMDEIHELLVQRLAEGEIDDGNRTADGVGARQERDARLVQAAHVLDDVGVRRTCRGVVPSQELDDLGLEGVRAPEDLHGGRGGLAVVPHRLDRAGREHPVVRDVLQDVRPGGYRLRVDGGTRRVRHHELALRVRVADDIVLLVLRGAPDWRIHDLEVIGSVAEGVVDEVLWVLSRVQQQIRRHGIERGALTGRSQGGQHAHVQVRQPRVRLQRLAERVVRTRHVEDGRHAVRGHVMQALDRLDVRVRVDQARDQDPAAARVDRLLDPRGVVAVHDVPPIDDDGLRCADGRPVEDAHVLYGGLDGGWDVAIAEGGEFVFQRSGEGNVVMETGLRASEEDEGG